MLPGPSTRSAYSTPSMPKSDSPSGLPALLGGSPVRTRPFSSKPFIDEREVDAVAQTVRDGLLSRFVGSPMPGTRDQLRRTSAELLGLDEDRKSTRLSSSHV